MTGQLTIPPAHVWDRIEKILDEQDLARKHTNELISGSFSRSRNIRRLNFFVAAVVGAGLLTYFILNHQGNVKES